MASTTPAYIPSPVQIFKLLAGGQFRPMDKLERDGRDGAGPDAMVLIRPCASGDLFIIADWQAGEGIHIEIQEGNGAVWALDHRGERFEQVCGADAELMGSEEDQLEAWADVLADLDRDDH